MDASVVNIVFACNRIVDAVCMSTLAPRTAMEELKLMLSHPICVLFQHGNENGILPLHQASVFCVLCFLCAVSVADRRPPVFETQAARMGQDAMIKLMVVAGFDPEISVEIYGEKMTAHRLAVIYRHKRTARLIEDIIFARRNSKLLSTTNIFNDARPEVEDDDWWEPDA